MPSKLINGKNTFTHDNTGRVLGRLMRDYDAWAHKDGTPQCSALLMIWMGGALVP
jgi:hypothetical protein